MGLPSKKTTDFARFFERLRIVHHAKNNDATRQESLADNESSLLVELCADQIKAAIDEAFREIDALARSVLDTARHADALLNAAGISGGNCGVENNSIVSDSRALREAVQNASSRLQFADRLSQRLSNVSKNLAGMAKLMRTADLPIEDTIWTGFLEETRATFTMEQERQMFDRIFSVSTPGVGADPIAGETDGPILFDGDPSDGQ